MSKWQEMRPSLAPGLAVFDRDDGSMVVVNRRRSQHLVISTAEADMLSLFDGRSSSDIVQAVAQQSGVDIEPQLAELCRHLAARGLMTDSPQVTRVLGRAPFHLIYSLRRLLRMTLLAVAPKGYPRAWGNDAGVLAGPLIPVVLLLSSMIVLIALRLPALDGVLIPAGDPGMGLLIGLTAATTGLSMRAIGRAVVLAAAGFGVTPLRVGLTLGIPYLDPGARNIVLARSSVRLSSALFGLAMPASMCAGILALRELGVFPATEETALVVWTYLGIAFVDLSPFGDNAAREVFGSATGGLSLPEAGLFFLRRKVVRRALDLDYMLGELLLLAAGLYSLLWLVLAYMGIQGSLRGSLPALLDKVVAVPPAEGYLAAMVMLVALAAFALILFVVSSCIVITLLGWMRQKA